MLLCLFLSGCARDNSSLTHPSTLDYANHGKTKSASKSRYLQEKDGAPTGPIPRSFKEVKPKNEPLSRYGNPDAYAVEGKKYQVLKNSTGYKTRGVASWYGTKFHKQRTSSGDKYDMYEMTAAHKTLPLPSYVKVRNLITNQVAIVKVNDRGPFRNDRIIDLSYAAANKLGLLPKGTAPVEIEALNTGSRIAHYYIQAGAFSSNQLAIALQKKLARMTPSPVTIENYKNRFIVRVGPFANKKMTDGLKSRMAANGIKGSFSLLR